MVSVCPCPFTYMLVFIREKKKIEIRLKELKQEIHRGEEFERENLCQGPHMDNPPKPLVWHVQIPGRPWGATQRERERERVHMTDLLSWSCFQLWELRLNQCVWEREEELVSTDFNADSWKYTGFNFISLVNRRIRTLTLTIYKVEFSHLVNYVKKANIMIATTSSPPP